MPRKLPKRDVAVIGLGWVGSIMAAELAAAGLDVIAFERGPWRDTANDFNIGYVQDELRYVRRQALMLQPKQETFTFRNHGSETALPMREFGAFAPGTGLGGAGVHWSGLTWRFQPTDFELKTHLTRRYGQAAVDASGLTLRDWGVTYDELEPFYTKFEQIAGIAGRGGNLKGVPQEDGNPFEGYRSQDYPMPPHALTLAPAMFRDAAKALGYKPFVLAGGNASTGYNQSPGRQHGPLHVVRLLLPLRLRQLLEVHPADDDPAVADGEAQLRASHRERGRQDRHRRIGKARDRRHVRRQLRAGMGAAGGPGDLFRVPAP